MRLRAISEDDKSVRKAAILRAASELLDEADYHEISIARVARTAGLAKGTIFLYFRTKEELFLQLQMKEYASWFDNVKGQLQKLLRDKKKITIARVVHVIMTSIGKHPGMVRMTPLIHVILEHNIDYETTVEFKRFLLTELSTTGKLMEQCLPFLGKNGGPRFLLDLHVLMIGIRQIASPAPLIRRVIEKEGMRVFRIDFNDKLKQSLTMLLLGLRAANK